MSDNDKIVFPEEYSRKKLNELYRQIPLKDTTFRMLRKYFNAFANLYGVIPLSKAYEIVSSQCPKLVNKNEFKAFAKIARHEIENYIILSASDIYIDAPKTTVWDDEIIDVRLVVGDMDKYFQTKQLQEGKKYYIPEKNELLKYDDMFYYELVSQAKKLRNFINSKMDLSDDDREYLMMRIISSTRVISDGVNNVSEVLGDIDYEFVSADILDEFLGLMQDFNNNTRMQCNRGFCPSEIFNRDNLDTVPQEVSLGPNIKRAIAEGKVDIDALFNQIMTAELPSEQLRYNMLKEVSDIVQNVAKSKVTGKVGRNDPCPCGSGKKYKHCCGKA